MTRQELNRLGVDFKPKPLSVDLANHIREWIIEGKFAPGELLPPEREIATALGVSRTSLREAIHELELKGFLDRRSGRGTVVIGPSTAQTQLLSILSEQRREDLETLDFRSVIEPPVAAQAARTATASDIARLEDIVEISRDIATAPDSKAAKTQSAEYDRKFHESLARATQNKLLVSLIQTANEWVGDARLKSHARRAGRERSWDGHQRLLEVVRNRDPEATYSAMREHLAEVREIVRQRGME